MRGFVWETAEELDLKLAQRVRNVRRRRSISQKKLADMSGVSYGFLSSVLKQRGKYSLVRLTKIAMALDIAGDLRNAFTQIPYQDVQEVINENKCK